MASTISFLHRIALLTVLTTSTALAGCVASDDVEEDEPASSETSELASAGIVPQVSIRGVKMGMTFTEVSGALGKPEHVVKFDGSSRIRWWEYIKIGHTMVYFDRETQRVSRIATWSSTPRTKEGVGVGSLRSAVDALPNTACFASRVEDVDDSGKTVVFYAQRCEISTGTAVKTQFFFPFTPTPTKDPKAKVSSIALEPR